MRKKIYLTVGALFIAAIAANAQSGMVSSGGEATGDGSVSFEILKIQYEKEIAKIQNSLHISPFDREDVRQILRSSLKNAKDVIDAMLQLKLIQQINKSQYETFH